MKLDVVIEFNAEEIHIGQVVRNRFGPVTRVRKITERHRPLRSTRASLDPETKRWTAVVTQLQGLDAHACWRQERLIAVVTDETGLLELSKSFEGFEPAAMALVAVKGDLAACHVSQRMLVDMVAVRVRQKRRGDVIP